MALAILLAMTTVAGFATAHDAGATNDHGTLTATPDAEACAVHFQARGVGAGGVDLEIHGDTAEPSLITREFTIGVPTTEPAPERDFAYNETVALTQDEARQANRLVMVFHETNDDGEREQHSAEVLFSPFECAVEPGTTVPECAPNVSVEALELAEGIPRNHITADEVADASGYRIYRDAGSGWELLNQENPRFGVAFNDDDVDPGMTYAYKVTSFNAAGENADCPIVEATAIPFFPGPLAAALATLGVAGSVLVLRRKA